jgi:hypothetical protein
VDLTVNGTWYMSFAASAPDFDYAAQIGLNDGVNELMWGNGYRTAPKGVAAHYGALASFGDITGTSGISPTMGGQYDVMLYVAQLQQVVGVGLTVSIYAYDLETTAGLPASIGAAGTALWSTTLTGVSGTFGYLELEHAGASGYPGMGQITVGTTWGDVTGNIAPVPEPGSLALAGRAELWL